MAIFAEKERVERLPIDIPPLSSFTAVPGLNDPQILAFCFQKHLKERLSVFLTNINGVIGLDLDWLLERVEGLDPEKRFSCALFGAYARIRRSYQSQDLQTIFDSLQILKNINSDQLYSPHRVCGTILTDSWEVIFIDDVRHARFLDEAGHTLIGPVQLLPLFHWQESDFPPDDLVKSEELILLLDSDLFREFNTYVSHIKLFLGKSIESFTSPRFFGALYLRLPKPGENPLLYYLNTIVHEVSHLHLFAMMGEDLLVLNEPNELFASPLRLDKRPMIGIFHATFVLARMVRILRRAITNEVSLTDSVAVLAKLEPLFLEGMKVIGENARLTERGRAIFDSMEMCAFG